VVLWLVSSDTIRRQNLDALKDRDHPYRLALERGTGDVEGWTWTMAVGITRARLNGGTVVIVATIQSFRRDDRPVAAGAPGQQRGDGRA
jgi:type III restriction enzyme